MCLTSLSLHCNRNLSQNLLRPSFFSKLKNHNCCGLLLTLCTSGFVMFPHEAACYYYAPRATQRHQPDVVCNKGKLPFGAKIAVYGCLVYWLFLLSWIWKHAKHMRNKVYAIFYTFYNNASVVIIWQFRRILHPVNPAGHLMHPGPAPTPSPRPNPRPRA